MATLTINKDETTLILDALNQAISSAKRQQNTKGRTMTIKEVYEKHERTLQALANKIAESK